jgi:hypothetical protein
VAAIQALVRRTDWEGVESNAKVLSEYLRRASQAGFEGRRQELTGLAARMTEYGVPLPGDLAEIVGQAVAPGADGDWNPPLAALGRLLEILQSAQAAFSKSITDRTLALAEWSGEPPEAMPTLDGRLRSALVPIREGLVPKALEQVNDTITHELPKAVARREAARADGSALLSAARDLGLPNDLLEKALRGDAETAPIDWKASVEAVEIASAQVGEALRSRVASTLESLRATLESLREYEVDPTESLAQIGELLGAVATAPPNQVPRILEQARTITEEPVVGIVASLLDTVRPRLVEARRLGRDPSEVFATMNRAREALRLKIYSEALAAGQEALDRVSNLTADLDAAREEAESLGELLRRLEGARFPTDRFAEALQRIRDDLGAVELPAAQQLLRETLRTLGQEAAQFFSARLAVVESILPFARERSFLPADLEEDLAEVRRRLDDGEIADAGERLSGIEVRLRTAAAPYIARRIEELTKGFSEIPDESLVTPVRRFLADADVNLRVREDLSASTESLRHAEREFTSVFAAHASAMVELLEEERRTLESMGGAGDEIQRQIDEVQQIFNMGDFVKASRASQEIRTRAHQQQLLRSEDAVSHAKLALIEVGKMGVEAGPLRTSLDGALDAGRKQHYAEAYRIAAETQEAALRLKAKAQSILDGLAAANELFQELKQAGVGLDALREKIRMAQVAYQALDFDGAKDTLDVLMALMRSEQANAEARRLITESQLLREDGQRLSVATDGFVPQLAEAQAALEDGRSSEALQKARQAEVQLIEILRPVLSENLRTLEQDLEVARAAGLDIAGVIEALGEARRRLGLPVPVGVAEIVERARSQLVETRGFLEHAERASKRALEAINQAELVHVSVPNGRERFAAVETALKRRDYARAIELASTLEREMIQLTYQQVSKSLAGFQAELVRARQEGGDTSIAENLLMQARTALEEGRPLEALQLAARSESEIERVELQVRIAQSSLKSMEEKLAAAEHDGLHAPVAQEKLREAQQSFRDHLYPIALELTIDASDSLAFSREVFRRARDALDSADRQVKEALELGADVAEVLPVLEAARAAQLAGEYPGATRKGREAAEMGRWSIERLYSGVLSEVRHLTETARAAGLTDELASASKNLEEAESALQTREWKHAGDLLQGARGQATTALTARIDSRTAEVEALYRAGGTDRPDEVPIRDQARAKVVEARERGAYADALAVLRDEETRVVEIRRVELHGRVTALRERLWIGEKLGIDTTPVMEAFSEAQLALQSGRPDDVPVLLERGEGLLRSLVSARLPDRLRDTQTELVFAQDGLHVSLADVAERLRGVPALLAGGSTIEAAQLVLESGEELNRRKALHRELMNLHYLIDAALGRAAERHADTTEARRLLDESIKARTADYALALEKARESLRLLQGLLQGSDSGTPATFWPFKRSPGA